MLTWNVDINEKSEHKLLKEESVRIFTIGRGRRTRTLNKGFGDPRVTITPYP